MKTFVSVCAVLFVAALSCAADDPKGGQVLAESQSVKAEKERKKVPVIPPKPSNQILGQKVIYGGYFTDFLRSESKRSMFNLKTPLDPQKDLENVSFYPGTQKVQGIVFFSIKF